MNKIYEEAGRVLTECQKGKISKVIKVPRSGATTGIIANLIDRGETFVLIAPTLRIAHEVANNAIKYCESRGGEQRTEVMRIFSNRECAMVQDQIQEHPMLAHLSYIPKQNCKNCENFAECPITRFIRVNDDTVVGFGMTYAKFSVMIEAGRDKDGKVQNCILGCLTNKFFDVDTIIFDEAHQIEEDTLVDSIEASDETAERMSDFSFAVWEREDTKEGITKILVNMMSLIDENEEMIETMKKEGIKNNQNLIKNTIDNEKYIELYEYFKDYMGFIDDIKKNNPYSVEDIKLIESSLNILKNKKIIVQYIQDDDGQHVFFGTKSKLQLDIQAMLDSCQSNETERKIIFTSATFSDTEKYKEVFGDYDIVRMEDVMETNQSMTLISDIRQLETRNLFNPAKKYTWAINAIEEILDEFPGIPVITVKKKTANRLFMRLKADGYNTTVDYYRSINMIGVDREDRHAIFVGMPVAPLNTFDVISESYLDSQTKRINQNHAAFYQAINRFKDPQGLKPSIIHCVGIKKNVLRDAIQWADARVVNFGNKDGRYIYDSIETVDSMSDFLWFDEENEYLRMKPFEEMNILNLRELKDRIAPADSEKVLESKLHTSIYYCVLSILKLFRQRKGFSVESPVDNIEEQYENILSEIIFDTTCLSTVPDYDETDYTEVYHITGIQEILDSEKEFPHNYLNYADYQKLFLNESTKVYAEQSNTGAYYKKNGNISENLYRLHKIGGQTYGIYPKSWDGSTKVSCIDIDTHEGDNPLETEFKLQQIMAACYTFGVPFVLEESSPGHIILYRFI